jgi:hypothetical protein
MHHFGEGAYVQTENAIRALLGLNPLMMQEPTSNNRPLTPETYLGTNRARESDEVTLQGPWKHTDEYIEANGDDCYLNLNFQASDVYLVLAGTSKTPMQVYLDGKFVKMMTIEEDRKYDIVSTSYGSHQLSIHIPKGIRAYAFTFGS